MSLFVRLVKKQSFHPTIPLGLVLNDFYFPRKGIRDFVYSQRDKITGKVLDIGCGSKPYQYFFTTEKYYGIDIENEGHDHTDENIDEFYDGKSIPAKDGEYDNVVCFEVLEHVFEPEQFLAEINRVLKPGGQLLLTTPFIWNEHEVPNDYGRLTSFGMKHLLGKMGFEMTYHKRILNGPEFFFVLIQVYMNDMQELMRKAVNYNKLGRITIFTFFRPIVLLVNILGLISKLLPRDNRFYFNHGVVAKKV